MRTDRNPRHSAYAGSVDDWQRFLSCWYRESIGRRQGRSLVKRDVVAEPPALSVDAIREEIRAHEERLELVLPRSYIDFLVAYYPTERVLKDVEFLHVSAIDVVESVFPGWAQSAMEYGENASDEEYFRYGIEQIDSSRSRYLESAIAVGMHDMDSPFMLVLHPEVTTSDGEMEAEAFFHAGSLRTPSFAEMMRLLYCYKVRLPPGVSSISQEMMRGTCADLLPMKDVWWK